MTDSRDLLLIELMVKLAAVQKVLVRKNLLDEKEITEEIITISKELTDQMALATKEKNPN